MKKLFFVSLILIANFIRAQELSTVQLDSLYRSFTFFRGIETHAKSLVEVSNSAENIKCGLSLVNSIKQNFDLFSTEQQFVLAKILQRPSLPLILDTPGGFFKIHYTDSGNDAIVYDINLLAQALDSSFNFEINYLGYPIPPPDAGEGGDNKYDIYVQNLGSGGSGLYGFTQFENKVAPQRWTSFMVIDNDYSGYFSSGLSGARVTVAHEFHHAIQGGNFGLQNSTAVLRDEDVYFFEISSTAMEEFVFNSVNDYYAYIPTYFRNPEKPFPLNSGYDLALWNIYLQKIYDFDILKRQWELIPTLPAISAINLSISERGSTLGFELNRFGVWTYFTGYRTFPGKYFEEASKYPLIDPTTTVSFTPPSQTWNMTVGPAANYFLKINNSSRNDTIIAIITNSDYQRAIDSVSKTFNFSYKLFADTVSGIRKLGNLYSSNLITGGQTFWSASEIINNIVVNGDTTSFPPSELNLGYSFPQPFSYKKNYILGSFISIPVTSSLGESVDLNIYSSSMRLMYSESKTVQFLANSSTGVIWDVRDNNGEKLPTGVYIYVVKVGDEAQKGKLVIFNE